MMMSETKNQKSKKLQALDVNEMMLIRGGREKPKKSITPITHDTSEF